MFITPGFVYEYTDFTCSHGVSSFGKTKARIAPRLRQESFPLAGDSGFRPCRQLLYQNQFLWRNRPGENLDSPPRFGSHEIPSVCTSNFWYNILISRGATMRSTCSRWTTTSTRRTRRRRRAGTPSTSREEDLLRVRLCARPGAEADIGLQLPVERRRVESREEGRRVHQVPSRAGVRRKLNAAGKRGGHPRHGDVRNVGDAAREALGECALKCGKVLLRSLNGDYRDIEIASGDDIKIVAEFKSVLRA